MIQIADLLFEYGACSFRLEIPALTIDRGQRVAIVGRSGTGKTTLLSLIAGAATPRRGSIAVGQRQLERLSDAQRRRFRASCVGFVFQDFQLLDYLSVRQNILLPSLLYPASEPSADTLGRLGELVDIAGLTDRLDRYPQQLSQGERQRVALCRALIMQPEVILADEPTGNLDPETADAIITLLLNQAAARQATLLLVTHDHSLLHRLDRTIDMAQFQRPVVAAEAG